VGKANTINQERKLKSRTSTTRCSFTQYFLSAYRANSRVLLKTSTSSLTFGTFSVCMLIQQIKIYSSFNKEERKQRQGLGQTSIT